MISKRPILNEDESNDAINPDKTRFVITSLGKAGLWSMALVVFGYTVGTAIGDFKKSQQEAFLLVDAKFLTLQKDVTAITLTMEKLHDEVGAVAKNSWKIQDMERLNNKFRWLNRGNPIVIPEPSEILTK